MFNAVRDFFVQKIASVEKQMSVHKCKKDDYLFVNVATCECFVIPRNKLKNCNVNTIDNQNIYLIEGAY